jgi:hypothetical protein
MTKNNPVASLYVGQANLELERPMFPLQEENDSRDSEGIFRKERKILEQHMIFHRELNSNDDYTILALSKQVLMISLCP